MACVRRQGSISLESAPEARGWKGRFGPEDLARDEHWTERALDGWRGWDAAPGRA